MSNQHNIEKRVYGKRFLSGFHKNDPDFDLATFSESIGHSSIRTTMGIYAHLDMTQNRYVQRSVEDLKAF